MATRTIGLTEELHDYLLRELVPESEVMRQLRAETAQLERGCMQISPEQGRFMMLLVQLLGARRCLEIGTFTGYSALCVASALPPDGQLVTCDLSEEWTTIARRYWQRAGVADRIDLRLGPALETLTALADEGAAGTFDFAFIDADKQHIGDYYEHCLRLVRVGGLVAIDNAFWKGLVADSHNDDPDTAAIRANNARVMADARVFAAVVPIGDGLLLARKLAHAAG